MNFKKIRMTQELLIDILQKHNPEFPDEMVICGASSTQLGTIDLLLYSPKFSNLPEGAVPELQDVTMEDLIIT
jgi:hypothetical protein